MLIRPYLILILLCWPLLSAAAYPDYYEYKLDNGLKLVVKEDHRAPVAVSQIWYHAGSAYEAGGVTGIAHMLEHMMFKGTKQNPAGTFSKLIASNGGTENAFTSNDYTAYFQELAADQIELSLRLESDRMHALTFSEVEFKKENEVVKEERRMRVDDNPDSVAYERFLAAAHLTAPYHHMVIGWMNDLQHMKIEDVETWYRHWYAPNNATLVIVGDVDHEKIYGLVKQYFGDIPSQSLPQIKPQREPQGLGQRNLEVRIPAKLSMVYIGFNTPSLVTVADAKEAYALEMISGILNSGNSSRLAKELIRGRQIAAVASAGYDLYSRFDSLFVLSGKPTAQHTVAELQQALLQQIQKLQTRPVSQQELQRVKAQVVAAKLFDRDSLFGQGMLIGSLESIGLSWRVGEEYVTNINAVTADDVIAAAKKYLTLSNMTIATLIPSKDGTEDKAA